MKAGVIKITGSILFICAVSFGAAQNRRPDYHPCFLKDSVGKNLLFIEQNAWHIFKDTFDCREVLLDSIAAGFVRTGESKYLYALANIRQNPAAHADDLFTDAATFLIEKDFDGFIDQLYLARGKLLPLQNEMVAALNMIVESHPLKQRYMPRLDIAISQAKDAKDKYKLLFLEKLKVKIDEEKVH